MTLRTNRTIKTLIIIIKKKMRKLLKTGREGI